MHKTKNREKVPKLEVIEVVLVQLNLVYNQYQQKSLRYYTLLHPINIMVICYILNQAI